MKSIAWIIVAVICMVGSSAWAACPTPLTIKDAGAITQNMSTTDDGGGNCQYNVIVNAPVVISGSASTIHDCSGTVTTGGTAQEIITSAQFLHGFMVAIQINGSNTDPLYWSDTTTTPTATNGSFPLNPSTSTTAGGSFTTPLNYPVGSNIYLFGATTGDRFSCRYW